MTKLKTILLLVGVFIATSVSAFFFDEYYRKCVRYFFKLFNGDNIIFVGKNFHLFPSNYFVFSFGLFSVLISIFIFRQTKQKMFFKILLTIFIFFLTTMTTSYLDSKSKIIECTACKDNKRTLNYNGINYDFHFICSLSFALLPFGLSSLTKRKLKTQTNKPTTNTSIAASGA
jgi:hypothetical protein